MATTDTDRAFKSTYSSRNMDQQGTRTPGSRTNRRQFEDTDSSETRSTSRFTRDRGNVSPSVTKKLDKMTIDDNNGGDDKVRDEPVEEEMPSARSRLKKDRETRSRGEDNDDVSGGGENVEKEVEEDAPKKSLKKTATGASAGRKRKEKKNLREKRRSTGVVIMPGQAADPTDEQAQAVAKNTAANTGDPIGADGTASSSDVSSYQETILQLQDELATKVKELDTLRSQMDTLQKQNTRLKDENSALLRVVGSLSGTGGVR